MKASWKANFVICLVTLNDNFNLSGCREVTKRGCVKVTHPTECECQAKLISTPWPFCCISTYGRPQAPQAACSEGRWEIINACALTSPFCWYGGDECAQLTITLGDASGCSPFVARMPHKETPPKQCDLKRNREHMGQHEFSLEVAVGGGGTATIKLRHLRAGKCADMTRQAVSIEKRALWQCRHKKNKEYLSMSVLAWYREVSLDSVFCRWEFSFPISAKGPQCNLYLAFSIVYCWPTFTKGREI